MLYDVVDEKEDFPYRTNFLDIAFQVIRQNVRAQQWLHYRARSDQKDLEGCTSIFSHQAPTLALAINICVPLQEQMLREVKEYLLNKYIIWGKSEFKAACSVDRDTVLTLVAVAVRGLYKSKVKYLRSIQLANLHRDEIFRVQEGQWVKQVRMSFLPV